MSERPGFSPAGGVGRPQHTHPTHRAPSHPAHPPPSMRRTC